MPDRVRFGTWNVYHGTHTDQLTPVLERLLAEHGEQLVLAMQEAGGRDITRWLKAHGMATFVHTDCRLAWLPGKWVRADARGARLSPTAYYRPDRKSVV